MMSLKEYTKIKKTKKTINFLLQSYTNKYIILYQRVKVIV